MNNILFQNAFDAIDDELIAEAKSPAIRIAVRRKKIIISAVAACIVAVLVAIPSVKVIDDLNDNEFTSSKNIEIIYQQSSEQASNNLQQEPENTPSKTDRHPSSIANNSSPDSNGSLGDITIKPKDLHFTNIIANGPTSTYEKIYTPDIKYLYINPIPTDRHVTIYERYYQKEIDQNEAQALVDKYFPKIAAILDTTLPQYNVYTEDDNIDIHGTNSEFSISVSQFNDRNRIAILHLNDKSKTILDGQIVTVNQAQNDEEIINSLSGIKQILFDMFDVSFDSAKISRRYYDSNISGESYLYVYFYDSNAHPLNNLPSTMPFSDCISISFDNLSNNSDDIVSNSSLYNIFVIDYWSYRTENHSPLKPVAQKELLPLEKAEEYLRKGYVLAMGGCPFCQANQTPVDFSNYEYISFEYASDVGIGDLTLPYYVFYKNIGTAENGNMIFAKTYVPAVEVEGYEEYFINKHNNHNNDYNNKDLIDDTGD